MGATCEVQLEITASNGFDWSCSRVSLAAASSRMGEASSRFKAVTFGVMTDLCGLGNVSVAHDAWLWLEVERCETRAELSVGAGCRILSDGLGRGIG